MREKSADHDADSGPRDSSGTLLLRSTVGRSNTQCSIPGALSDTCPHLPGAGAPCQAAAGHGRAARRPRRAAGTGHSAQSPRSPRRRISRGRWSSTRVVSSSQPRARSRSWPPGLRLRRPHGYRDRAGRRGPALVGQGPARAGRAQLVVDVTGSAPRPGKAGRLARPGRGQRLRCPARRADLALGRLQGREPVPMTTGGKYLRHDTRAT